LATIPEEWVRQEALDACLVATRRMGGAALKTVGVTSCTGGEGRSTIAAALAAIQAFEYERATLLVEFDLVRPSAARRFGLPAAPGVTDAMRGLHKLSDCIQSPGGSLSVIVAGSTVPARTDLLRTSAAEKLLESLTSLADVLIIDLPPMPGSGAVQLADLCETQVLAVRAGRLTMQQVQDAASTLATSPFIILNGTKSATPRWMRRMLGISE
jgi:Mrp family chromosome partitioning ATPase